MYVCIEYSNKPSVQQPMQEYSNTHIQIPYMNTTTHGCVISGYLGK